MVPVPIPIPHAASFDYFNAELERRCRARQEERAGRHNETIGVRLLADLAGTRVVPTGVFEPRETRAAACHPKRWCATGPTFTR